MANYTNTGGLKESKLTKTAENLIVEPYKNRGTVRV